jgi:hypothetical protein
VHVRLRHSKAREVTRAPLAVIVIGRDTTIAREHRSVAEPDTERRWRGTRRTEFERLRAEVERSLRMDDLAHDHGEIHRRLVQRDVADSSQSRVGGCPGRGDMYELTVDALDSSGVCW